MPSPRSTFPTFLTAQSRAALVAAHPGHELRVHGWMEAVRPVAFMLTQGDGPSRSSRLNSTARVIERSGAQIGPIFGRFTDKEIYHALLRNDHASFLSVLEELVEALVKHEIEYLVADAEEGYNPSHDACRYLARGAAVLASRRTGRTIVDFDYVLVAPPDTLSPVQGAEFIRLDLDEAALARKLWAAENYEELREEVARAVRLSGTDAFRHECLRARLPPAIWTQRPFYEDYGERQVAAGMYNEVIRYETHLRPLQNALWRHAGVET